MRANEYNWSLDFQKIYASALSQYRAGSRDLSQLFPVEDAHFLYGIGCSRQELYDFVEDFARHGEPEFEIVMLLTAVRRDYFLAEQKGKHTGKCIDMAALPPKSAEVEGIRWLPRLIAKAKAKLRGEMPSELMYLCGGDRPFLSDHGIDAAEFLRRVWAAGDDNQKIVDFVKSNKARLNER
jgi:hypothetical protein